MHKMFSVSLFGLLMIAWSTQAHAGFEAAQWGMTPAQVATALPDEAPLSPGSLGDSLEGKTVGNVGEHVDGERKFRAVYYYDTRGLTLVTLHASPSDCQGVLKDILGKHGNPYRVSDQMIFRLIIWHDAPNSNRLRLMVSKGICDLHYERLDDYKAVDDAQAAN